jgi:hypothetical protein
MSVAAAGGLSTLKRISTADTNAATVKATSGKVFGWSISNVNAAARFVKLYDLNVAPTVGTDVPKLTILVPGATTGGLAVHNIPAGLAFGKGISIAITTVAADNDATATAAAEQIVHLFFA